MNEGTPPATGRLLLLNQDGHVLADKTLTIAGHDKLELPLVSALGSSMSGVAKGSLELFDDNTFGSSPVGELVIRHHGDHSTVNLDEELLMPTMSQSHELRGLAVDAIASPILGVTSTSDQPVDVSVNCVRESDGITQAVLHVQPHELVSVRACIDQPTPMHAELQLRKTSNAWL